MLQKYYNFKNLLNCRGRFLSPVGAILSPVVRSRGSKQNKERVIIGTPIVETDIQAKEKIEILMKQMLNKNSIDENLKNTDPLKWVGLMNAYKNAVEEVFIKN